MTGVGADAHLLVWMNERRTRGHSGPAGPEDFPEEWRRNARFRLHSDLKELVRRGQLQRTFALGKGNLYHLTHSGELEAQRLPHLRRDPEGRQQFARNGLVSVAAHAPYSPTTGLEAFLATPHSLTYGDPLTLGEVRAAAAYLAEQGLATSAPTTCRTNRSASTPPSSPTSPARSSAPHPAWRPPTNCAPRSSATPPTSKRRAPDRPPPSRVRRALEGLTDTLMRHSTDGLAQFLYHTGRGLLS